MADQPSYRPLQPGAFFADGMSARPLPAGVVARQWLAFGRPAGQRPEGGVPQAAHRLRSRSAGRTGAGTPPADAPTDPARFVADFPFELTRDDLERGQERYTIFCAVCHDPIGTGQGKIVERGYVRPPNYHTDELARVRPLRQVDRAA